ncbi:hypothetical protein [Leuconostoc lactis]|uniref:hypothetical protein n=1 Tax=Leuconostoc lactis TaxID=1246 RepID=UPI0021A3F12B|nr:hypothetical protein [Leuconostoc lactis]MCT3116118.1 hypothetical protein [Leuconostoc lactis]
MGLTFDEASDELRLAIPEKFYSPTMHDIAVILETQTKVINLLREKYAPTVKMTEEEKNVIVDFKKNWTFTQFVSAIEGEYEHSMYFEKVEKTFRKMRIDNGYMIDEDKLMLAWLHPETIKIVDE